MQVTVEDISDVKKKIHVEIPREQVTRELDDAYRQLGKNAKLKGYRPGKAPRAVLERHFKKDIHADVVSNLVQNSFPEALKEADLAVIDTSAVDTPELDPETDFKYNATVELRPELADVEFKGLELKKTDFKVDGEEIDHQVEMLRKHVAEYKPAENRSAAEGDFVVIDYEGLKDGEPYEPTPLTENHSFKLGESGFTKDFDSAIVGMNPGDRKDVSILFPEDHSNPELAGQTIVFGVTLKEIREEYLPPVDDELAKKFGPFETVRDLRAQIEKNLAEGYEKRTQQELHEQIFEQLLTEEFEIPDVLVKYELDDIIRDTEMRFAQSGLSMDQLGMTREIMEQQYRGIAEKQVRRHVILNKIIEQENMVVADEELEAEYAKISDSMNQPADVIKTYYSKNPDKLDGFKHALLEKKAIDLIISQANIETVAPEETRSSENGAETE